MSTSTPSSPSQTLTLPGFANVHSHAFQRLMRGEVQRRDPQQRDTFWTWRERMYAHANTLDLAAMEAAARLVYVECLEGGYTAIGEFHYLHHDPTGAAWADPVAAAKVHVRAAADAGIRLNLLWCVYARGGFDRPASDGQRRFLTRSLDEVERALDALPLSGLARLGLAIHSVRAVPREWLAPLAALARARGLQLHVHAAEQRREVEDCIAHTGLTPVALLASEGVLGPTTTIIHGTWLDDADVAALASSGTFVGVCPSTEGDLGDGIPRVADLYAAGVRMCIGTDSHAVIDPFYEVRTLEYLARVSGERRCVLADAHGEVAPVLTAIGSDNGYASLGLDREGDEVELDLGDRVFEGQSDARSTALLGGHRGLVVRTRVGGEVVVDGGRWLG